MPLSPFGMRVWLPILLVGLAMGGVCAWNHAYLSLGVVSVLTLALLAFFRDPIRSIPRDLGDGDMLSPADGTVSAVFNVDSHEATGDKPASVVRIFLSVLNVHVNRSPFDGEVVALKHTPGKFLNAQTEESALVNESKLITMRIKGNETIGVRQVSGMIARTIVCPLKLRQRLTRGEKFGMIMFGSTTELILPRPGDVTVHVKKGDKVRGGKTLLATLAMGTTDEHG